MSVSESVSETFDKAGLRYEFPMCVCVSVYGVCV